MFQLVKRQIHDKPWLLVVAGLGFLVALTITFLVISIVNPPQLLAPR